MKNKISLLLALCLLAGLLCVPALAAEGITESGFYNIDLTGVSNVTIQPQKADGTEVTSEQTDVNDDQTAETFYPGSVRLSVTYSNAASGSEYVVMLVSGTELPTSESDIYYINQVTATSSAVSFDVYPMDITVTALYLYITSDQDGFTTISIPLHYFSAYTLGDVNEDGAIDVQDAAAVLNHVVQNTVLTGAKFSAADVVVDGKVDVQDAAKILNYIVQNITSLS